MASTRTVGLRAVDPAEPLDVLREAVTLGYYGGLTHRDVGENLGIPLETIRTRIRVGLIRLHGCLAVTR